MDPNDTNNPTPPEPAVDDVAQAMDAGVAAATPTDAPEPPAAEVEAPAVDPSAGEAEPPVPGTPEAAAAEAAKAGKDGDKKPEPDAAVEKEIADLGLKEKGAARLRELSAEVKSLAPIRDALEKAGVKSPEELGAFLQRNQAMTAVMDMMVDTGATNEQFTQTFDYLSLVHKASQGDRQAAQSAFDMVTRERNELAKALGIKVEGFDPLAEHADLQADVQSGDISEARALEIAESRRLAKLQGEARSRQQEGLQQQQAQEQAITAGKGALNALEAELAGSDPQYAAKRQAFYAQVQQICRDFPPSQWAAAAKLVYPSIAGPAPQQHKPPPGPMRPGGPRPTMTPTTDDPMEALNIGIASAG